MRRLQTTSFIEPWCRNWMGAGIVYSVVDASEPGEKALFDSHCHAAYASSMSATVESEKKVWREAELQALPDDGYIHEVVGGELVMSPKNNFQHESICTRLLAALENFSRTR